MTSQDSVSELLEKLPEWPHEEIKENVDRIIPQLIDCLKGNDKGFMLQAVHGLLVTCLPCMSISQAEDSLLRHAMPAAQLLFNEALEGITLRLEDVSLTQADDVQETLTSLLQVCMELLKCMAAVLQYIGKEENVNASDIPSVPKIIATLLLQTFGHCKDSESLYGDTFSSMTDVLSALFRFCHEIQCEFFKVISNKIHFNCTEEHDFLLLLDVLGVLGKVGEKVTRLDIKTMAEHWKGYARLVYQYLEHLKQHLDVAQPIQFLVVEIEQGLDQSAQFSKISDNKGVTRCLKTTSFLLKIVVKLCEQFGAGGGYLGECYSELLNLLLILYRYSPPFTRWLGFETSYTEDVERHIVIAADPLLSHLICENEFRREYFLALQKSRKKDSDEERLSLLLLSINVIKKLINTELNNRAMWLDNEREKNILGSLLTYLKTCHKLLIEQVSIPAAVRPGHVPRFGDLHEALVSHLAALILSSTTSQFSTFESFLLDSVMDTWICPAMIACDVWCIVARTGSAELCLNQVCYLADLLIALEESDFSSRPEYINISFLSRRIASFLSPRGKQTVFEKYSPLKYAKLWKVLKFSSIPDNGRSSVSSEIIQQTCFCLNHFLNNLESMESYNNLLQNLYALSSVMELSSSTWVPIVQSTSIVPQICLLWEHVTCQFSLKNFFSPEENRLSTCTWLSELIQVLCDCTRYLVQIMTNLQIQRVLKNLQAVVSVCSSSLKFAVMRVLQSLSHQFFTADADQSKVCNIIADIFARLLEDTNIVVKHRALETFDYFAHVTKHESIVANAVSGNSDLQCLVSQYLQRESHCTEADLKNVNDYLTKQSKIEFQHKCKELKLDVNLKCTVTENPPKKMRLNLKINDDSLMDFLDDDLLSVVEDKEASEAISRICKDADYLVSFCALNKLSSSSESELRKAVVNLKTLVNL